MKKFKVLKLEHAVGFNDCDPNHMNSSCPECGEETSRCDDGSVCANGHMIGWNHSSRRPAAQPKFTVAHITDAKRMARAEQYLFARTILRIRDFSRTSPCRILTLAGGHPVEEIEALRELWPHAYIVACDLDPVCVRRATEAGAAEGLVVDVFAWQAVTKGWAPPQQLEGNKFDVINLDFCGLVDERMRLAVMRYGYRLLTLGGIMMVTFSYGHDVVERFIAEARDGALTGGVHASCRKFIESGINESVIGRVRFLCNSGLRLRSVILYPGKRMPMCSVLWERRDGGNGRWPLELNAEPDISICKLHDADLEAALISANIGKLYACPQERIAALRRTEAARKAVATRRRKVR